MTFLKFLTFTGLIKGFYPVAIAELFLALDVRKSDDED